MVIHNTKETKKVDGVMHLAVTLFVEIYHRRRPDANMHLNTAHVLHEEGYRLFCFHDDSKSH